MPNTSILAAFERMWQHTVDELNDKSNVNHTHADLATISSLNELDSNFQNLENSLLNGNTTVAKSTHAISADSATTAVTAETSTKTTQDASGNVITETYETKTNASAKLSEAKSYADTQIAALVNAAPETLDTLGELATAFEENKEVVEALDASITNKQDKISDTLILVDTVTGTQHKIQIQNGQLVSFPVE